MPVSTACVDALMRRALASFCTALLSVSSSWSSTAGMPGSTSGSGDYP